VVRIVGIATDVTEQKQTEELLRKSEAEFRVTFENAAFGMALADPKGYFLKTNRSFQMLLGYTDAELQSMSFLEFTHPDDVEKDWNPYQELIEGKCEHYQIEKRYVRKNKEVLSVRLIVSAVRGAANELLYAIGMVEDITEKRKLENQFMRAQRLESIGTLAGGIAHDLNNVLAPIVMSCELLMKEVKDVAHSRLLTAIDSSAKRGVELVKQVVTFARGNE
jgi:PAS domain S-box-containing protein